MGNYATVADLTERLGTPRLSQLSAASGTTVDSAVVEAEIGSAEAEVDGYLANRIDTPVDLSIVPLMAPWLKQLTLSIAIWRLHWERNRINAPTAKEAYVSAVDQLKAYAEAEIEAPGDVTPPATMSAGGGDTWDSETLVGGQDNMAGL